MSAASKLIVVSNRLSISISEYSHGLRYASSPSGLAAALSSALRSKSTVWIGWNGMRRGLRKDELDSLHLPQQLQPINLAQSFYRSYYNNFSNGSLWPILHGFKPRRMYDQADWQASLAVTQRFAAKVVALAKPQDIIWIHDFHLIMLPRTLRELGCTNRIGYFLHTPFARPKLFQTLPHYREMLESLQLTDVCGFQTDDDVQRFKACQTLITRPGRITQPLTKAFPVGIDYHHYADASTTAPVRKYTQAFKKSFRLKTVILSVSRLDYTKGIVRQLMAVEGLLTDTPKSQEFIYKLIVAPSREDLSEYQELKQNIEKLVGRINKRFGTSDWQPVQYDYRSVQFDELVALYRRADIMLVVPLIDGMNLVAKEFVAAKSNMGVLILSKTAGAAQQLTTALQVDPTSLKEVIAALKTAVTMPSMERRLRHRAMRKIVKQENAFLWVETFTAVLLATRKADKQTATI